MHPLIKPFSPSSSATNLIFDQALKFLRNFLLDTVLSICMNKFYKISVFYFQVSLFMNIGLDLQRHVMRRLSPLILNKLVFFWRCTLSFRFDSTKSLQYSESQKMIAKTILYFFRGAEDGREATERCEGYCPGTIRYKLL